MSDAAAPLLQVRSLRVSFGTTAKRTPVVHGVSFDVPAGKTVAVLGESGCGKSVTARSILQLVDAPGHIDDGQILLQRDEGEVDVLALPRNSRALQSLRWAEIAMIFQDPRGALTPAYTVGEQIAEALRHHRGTSRSEARTAAVNLLRSVGIPAPERRIDDYPHEMSGGMCQRAMIAMALACQPRLLIADEPTTALDVTIQAQVLALLRRVQREFGTAILLITHDIGVVAEVADEVVVMYLGHVVERGPVQQIFDRPQHPYTRLLFASAPTGRESRGKPLPTIPGSVPDADDRPTGCPFRGRCPDEAEDCVQMPQLLPVEDTHAAACWRVARA